MSQVTVAIGQAQENISPAFFAFLLTAPAVIRFGCSGGGGGGGKYRAIITRLCGGSVRCAALLNGTR